MYSEEKGTKIQKTKNNETIINKDEQKKNESE